MEMRERKKWDDGCGLVLVRLHAFGVYLVGFSEFVVWISYSSQSGFSPKSVLALERIV